MSEYTIIIKNETDSDTSSPIAGDSGQSGGAVASSGKGKDKGSPAAQNIIKGLVAYKSYASPFISQIVNHAVNTVSLKTGAEELQQRIAFVKDTASSVANLGVSVLTGFAIGNVPGAIIGGLMSIATTVMSYGFKRQELDMQNSLEQISQGMLNTRAGGFPPGYNGSRPVSR